MDLKSNHTSPVITDSAPLSKSRLGVHSNLLPYSPPGTGFSQNLILTVPRKKTGILDDVRASGWLDAMKSSSPPHKKITKDFNSELSSTDTDVAYCTWMVIIFLFSLKWHCFVGYQNFLDELLTCSPVHFLFSDYSA